MNPISEPSRTSVLLDAEDGLDIDADWLDDRLYRAWIEHTLTTACKTEVASWLDSGARIHGARVDQTDVIPELSIRLCSAAGIQQLNRTYRSRDVPTNVLSFPSGLSPLGDEEGALWPLGDLALCPSVIIEEAFQQGKSVAHHRAHMTVHGVLHLLGHDHLEDAAADAMERLEIRILSKAMVPNPYSDRACDE